MKFLIDHQLPPALARALFHLAQSAVHTSEVGLGEATDGEVWRFAQSSGCVVVTKDVDFCHLARRPGESGQVVWVRIGNCSAAEVTALVISRWSDVVSRLSAGDRIIEIQ